LNNLMDDSTRREVVLSRSSELYTGRALTSRLADSRPVVVIKAPCVSVLMATYAGETPDNLRLALASIFTQTLPPDECVVVIDGPIPGAQERIIERFAEQPGRTELVVVRQPERRGLAASLNAGLARCRGELIARHDSDDIALPERLELQTRLLQETPELGLVCAWCLEFPDDPERPTYIKKAPEGHQELVRRLKLRNTICHSSIVVRRSALEQVGGYRDCFDADLRGELTDYDLYVRLIMAGIRFHCIQRPLVRFRMGRQQWGRRGGLRYAWCDMRFRRDCRRRGFLSLPEFILPLPLHIGFRLLPTRMRGSLYRFVRAPVIKIAVTAGGRPAGPGKVKLTDA
jgi:glycosyltransferase involved in cell wall biosynthesis